MNAIKSLSLLFILFFSLVLQSCKIEEEDMPEPDPISFFSIYHADAENKELDIKIDNVKANSVPFSYARYTGYNVFTPGDVNYKFLLLNSETVLHDTTITLLEDKIYSMFLLRENNKLKSIVTEDVWPVPASGNALIRLVNLSPDSPSINLVDEASEDLVLNQSFKNISAFKEIKAGIKSLSIKTAQEGRVLKEILNVNILSREIYTIVVSGYKDGTATEKNELKVELIKNHTIL